VYKDGLQGYAKRSLGRPEEVDVKKEAKRGHHRKGRNLTLALISPHSSPRCLTESAPLINQKN